MSSTRSTNLYNYRFNLDKLGQISFYKEIESETRANIILKI
jgi:hypothetical protein